MPDDLGRKLSISFLGKMSYLDLSSVGLSS